MKAIVVFSEYPEFSDPDGRRAPMPMLGVRLTSEGANDRLLLRMLELQCPAVRRVSSAGSGSGPDAVGVYCVYPDVVEIPLPREPAPSVPGASPGELVLSSGCPIRWGGLAVVRATHPPDAAVIRRGALIVDRRWNVVGCRVNGRTQPMCDGIPRLEDIAGGAVVELDLHRRSDAPEDDDVEFSAVIRGSLTGPEIPASR